MAKSTRNAKAKTATAAPAARVEGAADDHGQAGNVAENAGGADGIGAGGAGAVPSIGEYQEKPPRSDHEPEAHVDDRADLPADTGAGDPHANTPRGSSGTAREAASTGGGTTADTPSVGAQPGSPNGDIETALAEALAKCPLFVAASEAWKAVHPDTAPTLIRIASKVEGFRRAGIAHSKAPVDYPLFHFELVQIEMLLAEPNLKVEFA